ncbi:hypothetical protein B0H11DRAFT_2061371 [Mycena galericulata]|nr:hypothetical protein B0H11DRAFT_2061371 [Mycena galericulata]
MSAPSNAPLGAGCHRAGGVGAGATHPTSVSFSRCFDVVALRPRPDLLKNWPLGPACSIMHMHSSTTYATHFSSLSPPGPLIRPFRHIQMEQATPHPTNFTPVHPGPRTTHEPRSHCFLGIFLRRRTCVRRLADGRDGRYTTNIHTLVGPTLYGHFCNYPRLQGGRGAMHYQHTYTVGLSQIPSTSKVAT